MNVEIWFNLTQKNGFSTPSISLTSLSVWCVHSLWQKKKRNMLFLLSLIVQFTKVNSIVCEFKKEWKKFDSTRSFLAFYSLAHTLSLFFFSVGKSLDLRLRQCFLPHSTSSTSSLSSFSILFLMCLCSQLKSIVVVRISFSTLNILTIDLNSSNFGSAERRGWSESLTPFESEEWRRHKISL